MDEEKTYSWENEYERTWEALAEDDEGLIQSSVDDIVSRARRKRLLARPLHVRLGIMRHIFVVIDMSSAMLEQDLKPNRQFAITKLLELFISEFIDQNPVSQLGLILTRQKRAEKLTELGGNPQHHLLAVQKLRDMVCEGEPSLHNSLELATQTLRFMPGHASRELLVLMGSLTTCDSQDVDCTIDLLKQQNIRCSVIGLAAEVNVLKRVAHGTGGKYNVILDESHLKDLLMQYLAPPPATANSESSLIKMGFPSHQFLTTSELDEKPSLCMCHLEQKVNLGLNKIGYICPQCKSKYCDLPVECRVCGLVLVSAPHLARSYHHLFPITVFAEEQTENIKNKVCFGCEKKLAEKAYVCGQCSNAFCMECDLYLHDMLHYCPACF